MDEIIEYIASFCHEQWAHWMEYLFSKCQDNQSIVYDIDDLVIPGEFVRRWKRQMETDYKDLSESEKQSDRNKAVKFIDMMGITVKEDD